VLTVSMKRLEPLIRNLLPWRAHTSAATPPAKEHLWSIGIYTGDSPYVMGPPPGVTNPVLTREHIHDTRALFVADPFLIREKTLWYMFFEVLNGNRSKGELAFATSEDGFRWTYRQRILIEPFHLTYPYVFKWMNEYYMIPESHEAGDLRLYKAHRFPTDWFHVETLMKGPRYADSSIFRFDDKWWLFTENSQLKHDTLRLYYANRLGGPWREHPNSPVVRGNPHIARPGGRVVVLPDRIIRYAQDCSPIYGTHVRAFEITKLTVLAYEEREVSGNPILGPSNTGWNECGMHHIDPHLQEDGRWIASVDGWVGVTSLVNGTRSEER
jgi:hypothetical protein